MAKEASHGVVRLIVLHERKLAQLGLCSNGCTATQVESSSRAQALPFCENIEEPTSLDMGRIIWLAPDAT
jgi:hypothetical protein